MLSPPSTSSCSKRFVCGYKEGAKSVNPNIEVLETYVGAGFEAFSDPGKATEVTKSQLDQGVDVVYQVAGGAGAGVLQAAADAGKLGIGVDSNQNYLHPGNVLTSMLKRVDVATYNAITDEKNGKWTAGHSSSSASPKKVLAPRSTTTTPS